MSSSTLAAGLRCLRDKLASQQRNEENDEQLLHAFTTRRDDSAFAVLVRRHGPMVLHVCRRVLGHQHDAEDAFQATFLVLARNAASLRDKTALASWLHGTAYRTAMKAKQTAVRRRKHEEQTPARPPTNPSDELLWREVRVLLDEEIARLPEVYRSAFVLCCLENLSQAEAGRRLGLKERTVSNRLAAARKRLSRRLARRGVELTALLAATTLASGMPAGLMAKTVEAASARGVSAAVAELVQGAASAVVASKVKIGAVMVLVMSLLGGGGVYFLASPQRQQGQPLLALQADEQTNRSSRAAKRETAETVEIRGSVLDPDGKPAAGARVSVDPRTSDEKPMDATTTGKDGRFSLTLPRTRLVEPETKFPLQDVRILATAKGYGLDWRDVLLDDAGKEMTLRLVNDDVPIEGRILSLEGKPLAGVKVRIRGIQTFPRDDLDRALDAKRRGNQIFMSTEVRRLWYLHHLPNPSLMATTGADGRFRLEGVGRERIITLNVEGPGIHYHSFNAMTRRAATVRGPHKNDILYGATFEYTVKPSRLIRGTVREKGTGKPLAGIHINGLGSTAEAATDEQGRYELPGCPKESRYGIVAKPRQGAPYFGASIYVSDAPGLGPLTIDLELTRGIPCEGKVLDEAGKAVPGEVHYCALWPNPNLPDDAGVGRVNIDPDSWSAVHTDGTFQCVVMPGCGCLAFSAAQPKRYQKACVDPSTIKADGDKRYLIFRGGEASGSLLVQEHYQAIRLIKPEKETKRISETLRVAAASLVQGAVLDAEGKPLTDVRIRNLMHGQGWETLPSEKFSVHGVNPLRPQRLYFIHDARRLIGSVEIRGTETKPLAVRLQPWAGVRGRLLDKEGNPLRAIRVLGSEFMMEDGRTDDQGRFRLDGLIPGLRYDFHFAQKSGFSETLRKGFVGKPGEVYDLGDIRARMLR